MTTAIADGVRSMEPDDVPTPISINSPSRVRGFRVPDDLWEQAKRKAAEQSRPGRRVTVSDVLVRALDRYVSGTGGR